MSVNGEDVSSEQQQPHPRSASGKRVHRKGAWTVAEVMVLQAAKREDYEGQAKGGGTKEKHRTAQERWLWIEDICWRNSVHRSAQQCQDKWESLVPEFKKVLDYEKNLKVGQKSYWRMLPEDRKKTPKLPPNLPNEPFKAMLEWYLKSKAVDQGDLLLDIPLFVGGNSSPISRSNGEFSEIEVVGTTENNITGWKRKLHPKFGDGIHCTLECNNKNVLSAMVECEDRKDKRHKEGMDLKLRRHRECLEMNMIKHRETLELNQKLGESLVNALSSIGEGLKQLGSALQMSSRHL